MPPQRTPLRAIDGNRAVRGSELTPYQRGQVIGLRTAGFSPREIEVQLQHSRGAIRTTLALELERIGGVSLPRTGRPIIYNERDKRTMLRNLRIFPKSTFQERRDDTGLKMSNSYIKNLARASGLSH